MIITIDEVWILTRLFHYLISSFIFFYFPFFYSLLLFPLLTPLHQTHLQRLLTFRGDWMPKSGPAAGLACRPLEEKAAALQPHMNHLQMYAVMKQLGHVG